MGAFMSTRKATWFHLLCGLLFLLPGVVLADGGTGPGKITNLQFFEGHSGLLVRHATMLDPDNCGRRDWFILRSQHPFFREIYSLLLAANTSGKTVYLFISGCHEGMPSIKHVQTE